MQFPRKVVAHQIEWVYGMQCGCSYYIIECKPGSRIWMSRGEGGWRVGAIIVCPSIRQLMEKSDMFWAS